MEIYMFVYFDGEINKKGWRLSLLTLGHVHCGR